VRVGVSVARYRRRFLRPHASPRGTIVEREGLILSLTDGDGRVGQGEAAPIWWIDDERIEDAAADLNRLGNALELESRVLDGDDAERASWLERMASGFSASARAALDAASLDLVARRAGISVAQRLGARAVAAVELNALIVETGPDDVSKAVRDRMTRGYRVVKLKVGAAEPRLDVARARAARDALSDDATLRVDANAAWSFEDARAVLEAIGSASLDYVEEPLADATAEALLRLREATGVKLAVDESLDRIGVESLIARRCCDVVVLKPARLGGPTRTVDFGRRLAAGGLRVVLTDAIETAVGRAAVVHAAAALATFNRPEAIGLGGLELLAPNPGAELAGDAVGVTALTASGPGLTITTAGKRVQR
jgi:o-succinylbenzoate synthase